MLKHAFLIFAIACSAAYADSKPASDDSIRKLLEVSNARKLLDNVMTQVDGMMKNSIQQALHGQPITPGQQQIIQDMQSKMLAIFKDQMAWDKLEPIYLKVYRESLSQDEVDGIIAFYKTPAGQALINKMPLVMQRSMSEMQKSLEPMLQQLQAVQTQTLQALKAQSQVSPVPQK